MRNTITLFLLLFANAVLSQNNDSLKNILKQFSAKKASVERDSNITNTIYNLFNTTSIADLTQQKVWVDSLYNFGEKSAWSQTKYKSYLSQGRYLQRIGSYSEAFEKLEKAINFYKKSGNIKEHANAINIMSTTILNDVFDNSFQSQNYNNDNAAKYLNFLLTNVEIAKKSKDLLIIANQQTGLGLYYFCLKQYKNSYKHYRNAYLTVQKDPKKYWYQYYGGTWAQGLNLLYLNKTSEGFKLINIAKKACETKTEGGYENFLKAVIGLFLGNYYLEKGKPEMAISELNYGLVGKNIIKNPAFDRHYSQAFYKAYKATNNDKMALIHYEKLQEIISKKDYQKFKGQYIEFQQKYEAEKQKMTIKSLENEKLQKENEKNNLMRNGLIAALLAGLGLIFYIYKNNINLKTKNQQLTNKNNEIEAALLKGTLQERKRVASELHDNLSAKISGIKWRLEAIKPAFEIEKHQNIYASSINALAEVYTDVRLISHNLLPADLETKGLKHALENLVKEINGLEKTQFNLNISDTENRYKSKIEYELFSIILELSNNILKHSKAEKAEISLEKLDTILKLTVADNGVGFNELENKKGMGFANLKSRVDSINGKMLVENIGGVKVEIEVPVG